MITFLAGFILGCFFATGAIFLFCAFAVREPDLGGSADSDPYLAKSASLAAKQGECR